jgi:hypothetical protein
MFMLPAYAQDGTIEIAIDGVVTGAEGEVVEVASQPIDADLVGAECSGTLTIANNDSVHPNNDLILTSGDDEEVITDVESEPEGTLTLDETLTLGETLTISLRLGPEGVSSGGLTLILTCAQVEETTTTTVADTTTTTEAAPVGGVETGAGGTAGADSTVGLMAAAVGLIALAGGVALARTRRSAADRR